MGEDHDGGEEEDRDRQSECDPEELALITEARAGVEEQDPDTVEPVEKHGSK